MVRLPPRWVSSSGLLLTLLGLAAGARAEPPSPEELGIGPGAPRGSEVSLPGEESGVLTQPRDAARALLVVPRAVLAVPEAALRLGTEPIRLLMLLEDRYHVAARVRRFFFNDGETFGIFPTLFFETGFGANGGIRLVHRDLFGRGEGLGLRAGFGGVDRQIYALRLDSGERLGRAMLSFDAGYSVTNRSRFYTIGNHDEVDAEDFVGRLDARASDVAIRSRYVERPLHAGARLRLALSPNASMSIGERIRHREFAIGDGSDASFPWVTEVYSAQSLVGFEDQSDTYTDVHARYAKTRSDRPAVTDALPTRGVRVDVWGGYQDGIRNRFRFGRVGGDVQAWLPLFGADRVVRLRLRMASVIGRDALIPMVDLPTLGGSLLLRGYPRDRFRDRIAALSTVEYQFPVLYRAGAYVFVDAGRVLHEIRDLADGPLRVGFGGGFVAFKRTSFLMAIQVASSADGGVYLHLNFTTTDALGDLE